MYTLKKERITSSLNNLVTNVAMTTTTLEKLLFLNVKSLAHDTTSENSS